MSVMRSSLQYLQYMRGGGGGGLMSSRLRAIHSVVSNRLNSSLSSNTSDNIELSMIDDINGNR